MNKVTSFAEVTRTYLNKPLTQDELFNENKIVDIKELTGFTPRRGLERGIICNDKLVNVVSNQYGHLPNEQFFIEAERKLIDKDINYAIRSINRNDCSFVADYILQDEKYHVNVKTGNDDILTPMIRLVNSYDGSCKTMGFFGFYRQICMNGLNVGKLHLGFDIRHKGDIAQIVMPELDELIEKFIVNEFYDLKRKFEVLAETPITNLENFVQIMVKKTGLFKYEMSDKNPLPSLNARTVIETITNEANLLNIEPNYWLGYNAMNEFLHGKLKKSFEKQRELDSAIFETIYEAAMAN